MAEPGYRIRREEISDDMLVVVRGGLLDILTLRADAEAARRRFGQHGISVFAAPDAAALDDLAQTRMSRFELLTLITVGALRSAGLELVPTFRRPHYTILLPVLEDDLRRLLACENQVWLNPHYLAPEATP